MGKKEGEKKKLCIKLEILLSSLIFFTPPFSDGGDVGNAAWYTYINTHTYIHIKTHIHTHTHKKKQNIKNN